MATWKVNLAGSAMVLKAGTRIFDEHRGRCFRSAHSIPEARPSTGFGFGRFLLAIAGNGRGFERLQQAR